MVTDRVKRILEHIDKANHEMRHAQVLVTHGLRGAILTEDLADMIDDHLSPVVDQSIQISEFIASRTPLRRIHRGRIEPTRPSTD